MSGGAYWKKVRSLGHKGEMGPWSFVLARASLL